MTIFNKKKYIYYFIFVLAITLLMLLSFQYCDTGVYEVWSVEFWDCFFKGNVKDFYRYTALNPRGTCEGHACSESWIQMLPMIVWDLPIWIFHKVNGLILVDDRMSIIWHKVLFIIFTFGTSYFALKISRLFQKDNEKSLISFFIILISPEVLISTMYAGQDEIIYMCTFLISLYYFLQKKKKAFTIWSIVTDCLNPMMLMFTIALLLIAEKKIYKILINIIMYISPLLLFKLAYRNDVLFNQKSNPIFADSMFSSSLSCIQESELLIPIVVIIIIFIYFKCYITDIEKTRGESVIWLITALVLLFEFLVGDEFINLFYRSFLYVPFVAILISISKQDLSMNLFLLDIMTYFRTVFCISENHRQAFNTQYVMENRFISRAAALIGNNHSGERMSLYDRLVEKFSVFNNLGMISAIVIAVGIIFLKINKTDIKGNVFETKLLSNKNIWILIYFMCMPLFMFMFYYILFT